jgi:hypothetical protein
MVACAALGKSDDLFAAGELCLYKSPATEDASIGKIEHAVTQKLRE